MTVPQIGTYATVAKFNKPDPASDLAHKNAVNAKLDQIQAGKVNWVYQVTLQTGSTTTVVPGDTVTPSCHVSLDALTPEASALKGKVWAVQTDRLPGSPSGATQVGTLTLEHPVLNSGVNAVFRLSVKG